MKLPKPAYYDPEGNPITQEQWAERLETDERIITQTKVGSYTVSTMWLGLDHDFLGDGPPIIFETMVFGGDNWQPFEQDRYSTQGEALAGHEAIVEKLRRHIQ